MQGFFTGAGLVEDDGFGYGRFQGGIGGNGNPVHQLTVLKEVPQGDHNHAMGGARAASEHSGRDMRSVRPEPPCTTRRNCAARICVLSYTGFEHCPRDRDDLAYHVLRAGYETDH